MPNHPATSDHGCYGYRVACSFDRKAQGVITRFFGPPLREDSTEASLASGSPAIRLTLTVADDLTGPPVEPAHNLQVLMGDPISIDLGSSRAMLDPGAGVIELALGRGDLDNQIVWGRWILERLFLYLVCRSPRHYPLHAGAIAIDGQVAILGAGGGVGKSTFTFWALHRGAELVGEDILVRHMDDLPGMLWGYPRALYLAPEMIARSDELARAWITEVDGGRKCRVTIPESMAARLRPGARATGMVFLTRGRPGAAPRPLEVDEAVERCREDFATGKDGPAAMEVEADLRQLLHPLRIWELEVSDDLDESYDRLRAALRTIPATAS